MQKSISSTTTWKFEKPPLMKLFEKYALCNNEPVQTNLLSDTEQLGKFHEFLNKYFTHLGFDHDLQYVKSWQGKDFVENESENAKISFIIDEVEIYADFGDIPIDSADMVCSVTLWDILTVVAVRKFVNVRDILSTAPSKQTIIDMVFTSINAKFTNIVTIHGLFGLYNQESFNLDTVITVYYKQSEEASTQQS